jgi:hypothetical protein
MGIPRFLSLVHPPASNSAHSTCSGSIYVSTYHNALYDLYTDLFFCSLYQLTTHCERPSDGLYLLTTTAPEVYVSTYQLTMRCMTCILICSFVACINSQRIVKGHLMVFIYSRRWLLK